MRLPFLLLWFWIKLQGWFDAIPLNIFRSHYVHCHCSMCQLLAPDNNLKEYYISSFCLISWYSGWIAGHVNTNPTFWSCPFFSKYWQAKSVPMSFSDLYQHPSITHLQEENHKEPSFSKIYTAVLSFHIDCDDSLCPLSCIQKRIREANTALSNK